MSNLSTAAQLPEQQEYSATGSERGWTLLLCIVCLAILFSALGAAGLFEPDEGRNAEKAREILLIGDWVTPLQNFIPTLDKPIAFYWLVALSFKLFGISEWSARLPSALSAVGCLFILYRFARAQFGVWVARWSSLVLVTSIEFFILARIVILDLTLTFFITLALCSFYTVTQTVASRARTSHCVAMYAAIAAGTLVKGPIALAIPAMVIFFFLSVTRKWSLLRTLHLPIGILVYFAIVTPWYLWVEARNPGYLRYFLWEEHVLRFVTPHFSRTKSWYYFFGVLAVGFLPWTLLLPVTIRSAWRTGLSETNIFLALWTVLPFVFFSVSNAKLPHYILPIFPALALLTGKAMTEMLTEEARRRWSWLYAPLGIILSLVLYLVCGIVWPHLLASQIRETVLQRSSTILIYGLICLLVLVVFIAAQLRDIWREQRAAYLSLSVGLALFLALAGQLVIAASARRSSRDLAGEAAQFINPGDRIVFYDTYLEGLSFYLGIGRPIWLVQSVEKGNVMGSFYVGEQRPVTSAAYGQILFTFEEFAQEWKRNTQDLRVFVKEKNLSRLGNDVGAPPRMLLRFKEYALVTNR